MLVPTKKAVSNKHIILLVLTLTTFRVQRGIPNQIVAHDTRDLMDDGESSQSSPDKKFPVMVRRAIDKFKMTKDERIAEAEKEKQSEALAESKKKRLIKAIAKYLKEQAEEAKRLGTIPEEIYEGFNDHEDYMSALSAAVNEGKHECSSSLHKKESTLSDKSESFDLRQEGTSFGAMKDGKVKSPKRFLRSANGETDGEVTTKSVPLLSAAHKRKNTVDDGGEQD